MRKIQNRWEVFITAQYSDGVFYPTKQIGETWVDSGASQEELVWAAKEAGGDMLLPPSSYDHKRDCRILIDGKVFS